MLQGCWWVVDSSPMYLQYIYWSLSSWPHIGLLTVAVSIRLAICLVVPCLQVRLPISKLSHRGRKAGYRASYRNIHLLQPRERRSMHGQSDRNVIPEGFASRISVPKSCYTKVLVTGLDTLHSLPTLLKSENILAWIVIQ